jgi:hypothetical protein
MGTNSIQLHFTFWKNLRWRVTVMDNLIELNELLLEVIIQYMDATGPAELSLLDVLTDACMEIEEYLGKHNTKDIIQH